MYVVSIKTSDASCVITHSFNNFTTGSFEFSSLVLQGVKKRLKRENVPWFKLLLEMKFILTRQT